MVAAVPPQPLAGLPTRPVRLLVSVLVALASLAPATAGAGGAAGPSPDDGEAAAPTGFAAPVLETRGIGANEGHVQLAWEPAPGTGDDAAGWLFELQESTAPDFGRDVLLRYAGPQQATFVSGLSDGPHYFRLRQRPEGEAEAWSPWSRPLAVEFEMHSMALAWTLFGTGGALVAAVVGFLLVASARTRHETFGEVG